MIRHEFIYFSLPKIDEDISQFQSSLPSIRISSHTHVESSFGTDSSMQNEDLGRASEISKSSIVRNTWKQNEKNDAISQNVTPN